MNPLGESERLLFVAHGIGCQSRCQNCGYSLIEEDLDLEQAVIKEQEDEQNIEDELAQNNQIPAIEYSDEELQAGDAISADDGQPSEEEQKTISIPPLRERSSARRIPQIVYEADSEEKEYFSDDSNNKKQPPEKSEDFQRQKGS